MSLVHVLQHVGQGLEMIYGIFHDLIKEGVGGNPIQTKKTQHKTNTHTQREKEQLQNHQNLNLTP